jgi:cell division transport system permease protein
MRLRFVISEVGIGLRRNLTLTIAVVATVAVSLLLLGIGLLIRIQVDTMKGFWYDKVEVAVFLCGKGSENPNCAGGQVTQAQRDKIAADLRALKPTVQEVFYESQGEAFKHFKEQYKDSAITKNVTADQLPESFRVKLSDPSRYQVVASAFAGQPGIDQVQDQRQLLDRLFTILNRIQWGALALAGIQFGAAVLLIVNIIRVAAFSRRREIGIMRLVGASNFSIQLPFLLEGVIAGLVGAFFAVAGLAAVIQFFFVGQLRSSIKFTAIIDFHQAWPIFPWLFVIAVVVSSFAAVLSLSRYLRV